MSGPPVGWALAAFLAFVVAQRAFELLLSARNARRLFARGAREHGREHFPLLVVLHTLAPIALIAEVWGLGTRPGAWAPLWLALWILAQGLRWASMWALGERWNVRVIVLPGVPLVRRGPYRWLRHPNYLAVAVEVLAGPLLFGARRTALAFSIANLLAHAVLIRSEERALAGVEPQADPLLTSAK
jgi:methyltransferase